MIQNTVRMWTIAFLFTTAGSGINMLLSLRRPSIVITSIVAQLLSFPIGKAWGKYMPAWEFKIFGRTIHLNPGPFNIKEHTLIIVSPPLVILIRLPQMSATEEEQHTPRTFSLLRGYSMVKISVERSLSYWCFLHNVWDMHLLESCADFSFGQQRWSGLRLWQMQPFFTHSSVMKNLRSPDGNSQDTVTSCTVL